MSLKQDPDFLRYQKIHEKIESDILNHYYRLPASISIKSEMANAKSPDAWKAVLKKHGMQNSDEYIDDIVNHNKAMFAFIRKHPELSKLGVTEFKKKMTQLLEN
jgi:hypothetical protein